MNEKKKDIPIVILHGWGSTMSGEKYETLKQCLEKYGYSVYTPDLPGFGKNLLKKEVLEFEDYVNFIHDFIGKTVKAKKVILIGHSFGGRIAIRLAKEYPKVIEKLILTGASGIPQKLSFKKKIVSFLTKIGKPLFVILPFSLAYPFLRKSLYRSIGEMDYYKAGVLQKTFKNIYHVNITPDLGSISVPTLLIWGEADRFTPLADGKLMYKSIPNAHFVSIPNASHKLPYEQPDIFAKAIMPFIL